MARRPPRGPHHWEATEALARGEAVKGGPGACQRCHHGKVWHKSKTMLRRCERCDCPRYVAPTDQGELFMGEAPQGRGRHGELF